MSYSIIISAIVIPAVTGILTKDLAITGVVAGVGGIAGLTGIISVLMGKPDTTIKETAPGVTKQQQ
ncbi:MAG: hypothetical protein V4543_17600 [Bacteroidota bacterium]